MSRPTGTATAWPLVWKAPIAGVVALVSAVLVATVALALGGATPTPAPGADPRLVLAGALAPVVVIVLATLAGLLWAVGSVGVLTGDAVSGRKPRLVSALGRGFRALPKLTAVALVGVLAVLV